MNDLLEPYSITLPELPVGWYPVSFRALSGNRLGILASDEDIQSTFKSTSRYLKPLSPKVLAKIWIFDGDGLYECFSFPLLDSFPEFDQFPDGNWLVVNSRSRGEGNARIFQANGELLGRIELGDGIEHIKIDESNRIWVGWCDQGVGGNDKWKYAGLKRPPSSYGIAAFNVAGELLERPNLISPFDCYSLNVFNSEAWSCFYTGFPIWQMSENNETVWESEFSGISALAVSYPYVLLAGGYQENTNRLCLMKLVESQAIKQNQWATPLIARKADIRLLDGRANILHLVDDKQWHRWDVATF